MLPEASVARVPLGAADAAAAAVAAAGCTCVGDCLATPYPCLSLLLAALEQSSDRGPASVFCGAIGHAWKPTHHGRALECCSSNTQQYKNSNNRRTSAARIGCCCSNAAECCCCCC